jgi:predicted DNA-binding protein
MSSQHKHNPIPFRPPDGDRARLKGLAERTGQPVNRILAEALAAYLDAAENSTATRTYIAEDHARHLDLTFPASMLVPGSITLEEAPLDAEGMVCGAARPVVFWYNPGPIESMGTATAN